jgi:hypothetical protein
MQLSHVAVFAVVIEQRKLPRETVLETLAMALQPIDDQVVGAHAVAFGIVIDAGHGLGREALKRLPGPRHIRSGRGPDLVVVRAAGAHDAGLDQQCPQPGLGVVDVLVRSQADMLDERLDPVQVANDIEAASPAHSNEFVESTSR